MKNASCRSVQIAGLVRVERLQDRDELVSVSEEGLDHILCLAWQRRLLHQDPVGPALGRHAAEHEHFSLPVPVPDAKELIVELRFTVGRPAGEHARARRGMALNPLRGDDSVVRPRQNPIERKHTSRRRSDHQYRHHRGQRPRITGLRPVDFVTSSIRKAALRHRNGTIGIA